MLDIEPYVHKPLAICFNLQSVIVAEVHFKYMGLVQIER